MGAPHWGLLLAWVALLMWRSESLTLSSRLIHRFSDEAKEIWVGRSGMGRPAWPSLGSGDYYRALLGSDLQRQRHAAGDVRYRSVFPSQGSDAMELGNDFGWLHYTWVDIGTPNVSFLVALDAGSDYFWVPCNCIQCATLSGRGNGLAKDLSMYSPSASSTSKHISCSNELCTARGCKSPKQQCPYYVGYFSVNTSSSGLLVEDILYLTTGDVHGSIKAPVVIGCGNRQSGGYLDGIAPDGVLGLGPGDISVPTALSKQGVILNSFSLCFEQDGSGRILFGDQGVPEQLSTPFIPLEGKYSTYIIEVESWCIDVRCLPQTRAKALVDSGSSFTYMPENVYNIVVAEFDRKMNGSRIDLEGLPWEYCYRASSLQTPVIPRITLMLATKKSFVVNHPNFLFYDKEGKPYAFCLTLQHSDENFVTIGQDLMTGYRMVFDREKMELGWSSSHCRETENTRTIPLTPPSNERTGNSLPTIEERSPPSTVAVAPAIAGRAPIKPSAAAPHHVFRFGFLTLLFLLAFSIVFAGG